MVIIYKPNEEIFFGPCNYVRWSNVKALKDKVTIKRIMHLSNEAHDKKHFFFEGNRNSLKAIKTGLVGDGVVVAWCGKCQPWVQGLEFEGRSSTLR